MAIRNYDFSPLDYDLRSHDMKPDCNWPHKLLLNAIQQFCMAPARLAPAETTRPGGGTMVRCGHVGTAHLFSIAPPHDLLRSIPPTGDRLFIIGRSWHLTRRCDSTTAV